MPTKDATSSERLYSAFISHASSDRKAAYRIVEHIEKRGLTCWIAPRDIAPGAEYADEIMRGIAASRCFVIVLTEAANQSSHVRREIERAASRGKAIYPIRLEDIPPSPKLEYFISMHHWIDAFDGVLVDHADKLATAIDSSIVIDDRGLRRHRRIDRRLAWCIAALAVAGISAVTLRQFRSIDPNEAGPVGSEARLPAPQPREPRPESNAGTELGADFFRPSVIFSNGTWAAHMPTRVGAKFVNARLMYSFDGKYYSEATQSPRFFFSEKPPGRDLYIEYIADGTTYGPFRYNFDFGAMKTAELVRNRIAGSKVARLIDPIPGDIGGFSLIASYTDDMLRLQAVTDEKVARYEIDFGTGFYESFNPASDGDISIRLFDGKSVSKKYDGRIGLIFVDREGGRHGPVQFDVPLPLLMKLNWLSRFDELEGIECERRDARPPIWSSAAQPAKVVCRPGGYGEVTIKWSAIKRVQYGLEPQLLDKDVYISPTDSELTTQAPLAGGHFSNQWGLRNTSCYAYDRTELCFFYLDLPYATEAIYAKLTYHDGRMSSVLRFPSKR